MPDTTPCPFCSPAGEDMVAHNTLCYARFDHYPVSKGHLLIIPFRHTPGYFSLTRDEKVAMTDLLEECRAILDQKYQPAGYNFGYNVGVAAGQTVMHCHCHVIPRYPGDTDNPRGGMRRVVAGKHYREPREKSFSGPNDGIQV